jgi:hypothetical protein
MMRETKKRTASVLTSMSMGMFMSVDEKECWRNVNVETLNFYVRGLVRSSTVIAYFGDRSG